jgi:hypothetical protein
MLKSVTLVVSIFGVIITIVGFGSALITFKYAKEYAEMNDKIEQLEKAKYDGLNVSLLSKPDLFYTQIIPIRYKGFLDSIFENVNMRKSENWMFHGALGVAYGMKLLGEGKFSEAERWFDKLYENIFLFANRNIQEKIKFYRMISLKENWHPNPGGVKAEVFANELALENSPRLKMAAVMFYFKMWLYYRCLNKVCKVKKIRDKLRKLLKLIDDYDPPAIEAYGWYFYIKSRIVWYYYFRGDISKGTFQSLLGNASRNIYVEVAVLIGT